MLYYDFALTFGMEVERFWGRRLTLVSCVFFLNRYIALAGHIPVFWEFFGHSLSLSVRVACTCLCLRVLILFTDVSSCDHSMYRPVIDGYNFAAGVRDCRPIIVFCAM